MAHELTIRENGTVEMAYLEGVERWHGLGNELTAGATIEEWISAAGMDWTANRARVRFFTERGDDGAPAGMMEYPNQVVLFRSDNMIPLGIVSDRFERVQPREVMEFWRDLTGEAGMMLQTAGTLFGGKKLWALARVGEAAIIDPRNIVRENLLLATALDGTMATESYYCSTVVVCNNTLRAANDEGTPKVRIPHSTKFDARRVKSELGVEAAQSAFDRTVAAMRELAEKRMRESDVVVQTSKLFKPDYDALDDDGKAKVWRSQPVEAVSRLALDGTAIGSKFDGVQGTAWGWLNSVTEYVDHASRTKTADHRQTPCSPSPR
jgi:phage/plasmid-like protein (TIGR03299 family)